MSKDKNQTQDFSNKKIIKVPAIKYWDKAKTKLKFKASVWENGSLKYLEHLNKSGKRDGLTERWHENGQKLTETNYKDGELHGLFSKWRENGEKELEGDCINGQEHGKWKYFDEQGKLTSTDTWDNGRLVLVKEPNENHRFSHEEVQPAM